MTSAEGEVVVVDTGDAIVDGIDGLTSSCSVVVDGTSGFSTSPFSSTSIVDLR